MSIKGVMPPVRARQPFRWALVCALLALAGGFPTAQGGYAEVASATAVAGAPSRHHAARALAVAAGAVAPPALALVAPARDASSRAVARLYLVHASLLL